MGNMGNSESLQVLPPSSDLLTESSPERGITTKEMVRHDYPTNDKLQRKLYHGQWENGKRNGKGTLEWRNGAIYEGSWENDALCGLGSFLLPAGIRYEGEFKDNQFHGNGVLSWLSGGRRYEGSWQDSKHHGFGVLYFAEDDARVRRFYRGEWRDGKRHGFGIMEWQTGARYEGQWEEGKREGKGKQLFANGDTHVGYWQSAKRHGPGCRLFKNGDKLMGTWKNDKRHGLCEYHYAHGRVKEMLYINGVLQENEPLPQQVPSLKILCIETIGKNKKLARTAEELLPDDLADAVCSYRENHAPSNLSRLLQNMFSS